MWYVVRLGTISTKTVKNAIGAVLLLVKLNKRDCNWTRTHNHLVRKRTLNHLAKLASCSHLNFRFCACFEQGFLWHPGNYRVWIHSETRTWHDKNIQPDKNSHLIPVSFILSTDQSFNQNFGIFCFEFNNFSTINK